VQSIFSDPLRPQVELIEESQPEKWTEIEIDEEWPWNTKKIAIRLNGFGSLFYFSKIILAHTRLSPNLHGYMCRQLEREELRLVMEIPRSHFKSTCATISGSMWWALPFLEEDEQAMLELGYGAEWIRWMKYVHNAHTRTLICSEIGKNVKDLGDQIDQQYQKNSVFRLVYPEIIPKSFSKGWNESTKTHVRCGDSEGYHGEGTYDLIGAGSALQSRHYKRIIEDDLVGEDAIKSDVVMNATYEWHQKMPGMFEAIPDQPDKLGDQLVIGNRWSKKDVNQLIRDNNTLNAWDFITHDAEGGCCDLHPVHGQPIFPEEYSMKKLAFIKVEEGAYNYSCQYRNNPVDPEAVRFNSKWLRHFSESVWEDREDEKVSPLTVANYAQLPRDIRRMSLGQLDDYLDGQDAHAQTPMRMKKAIRHEVEDGETIEDVRVADLDRVAIIDPNHSGDNGRSRNAIVVLGFYNRPKEPRRIYLLDCWAEDSLHERWIDAAVGSRRDHRGLCLKWKVHYLYGEFDAGGQKGWQFYFKDKVSELYRNGDHSFGVRTLKTDRSANGMHNRIIGMESIYENGWLWVSRRGHGVNLFLEEYTEYPNGKFTDLLSTIGYAPQTWSAGSRAGARSFVDEENRKRKAVSVNIGQAGY